MSLCERAHIYIAHNGKQKPRNWAVKGAGGSMGWVERARHTLGEITFCSIMLTMEGPRRTQNDLGHEFQPCRTFVFSSCRHPTWVKGGKETESNKDAGTRMNCLRSLIAAESYQYAKPSFQLHAQWWQSNRPICIGLRLYLSLCFFPILNCFFLKQQKPKRTNLGRFYNPDSLNVVSAIGLI